MILVETLEDLVHLYLENPARPGSAVGKVSAQDLAGRIAHHLAECGVDIGFTDGSRLTMPGTTPALPEPQRHRLPLVLHETDGGHVRIYCDGRGCVWSWLLYQDASVQTKGEAISGAVQHALGRHVNTY